MSVTNQSNMALSIYNGSTFKSLSPMPLVGISHTNNRNEMGFLHTETTITLTGYVIADKAHLDACGATSINGCLSPAQSGVTPVGMMFSAQRDIENIFNGADLSIRLCDTGGSIKNSYACQLESINFEQGTWNQYMPYTVTLKSYNSNFVDNSGTYRGRYNGPGTSGVLTDFTDTFSVEPITGEYGLHRANPGDDDQEPISQVYYKCTRSISASAKTWTNRKRIVAHDGIQHNKFKNTDGIAPGWVVAHDYLEEYIADPTNPHYSTEFLLHSGHWVANSTSTNRMLPYNFTRQTEIDKASGRYSFTDNFILAPKDMKSMETFDVSYNSSSDSNTPTISVNGTIQGLSQLSMEAAARRYTDIDSDVPTAVNNTQITNSGQIDSALLTYYDLTKQGDYGFCRMFNRAQQISSQHLNTSPKSITMGTNDVAGQVTYTIEYDARPYNFFEGCISENITVEDTYPGDMYTTIPILGRATGPILQYLYGRTEYKRTVSAEIVLDSASTSNAATFSFANRDNVLGSKPSLRTGFREKIQALINLYSPANEPGIRNWFQDPPQESWSPKESRYSITITWTYELSE